MSRPSAFAVLSLLALSVNAQTDNRVGTDETILRGDLYSIKTTREGESMLGGLFRSCGTQILEISNVRVLLGPSLPDTILTTSPLGEFCSARFDLRLSEVASILASVRHSGDALTVVWITDVFPAISLDGFDQPVNGPDVVAWTEDLEERYGSLVAKDYWCDELDPADLEYEERVTGVASVDSPTCYLVSFDEFVRTLDE